jgi:hypothetical protein
MDIVLGSRALRCAVTAAALVVALALVAGVRPRVLAEETGVAPMSSNACFLCDGAASAASAAPAGHVVGPALPAPAPGPLLSEAPTTRTIDEAPEFAGDPPPAPPPRA